MEIYVEEVFLSNAAMNLAILLFTRSILSNPAKMRNIVLATIFASIVGVFFPLIILPDILLVFVKLVLGAGIVLIAFKFKTFKNFLSIFFIYLLSTAVFGGISFAILYAINGTPSGNIFEIQAQPITLSLIYFASIFTVAMCKSLLSRMIKNLLSSKLTYSIILSNGETESKFLAFLDTGNQLVDPQTKKPIMIISTNVFQKLFGEKALIDIYLKRYSETHVNNPHFVDVSGVGTENKIFAFELKYAKIVLDKESKEILRPMAGLTFSSLSHLGCNCILNPLMLIDV